MKHSHVQVGLFQYLAAVFFTMALAGQPATAQPGEMSPHSLDGFSLSVPAGWKVTTKAKNSEINAKSPDGKKTLMAWWWFPDEPLLGYPDIVSHKKITVAGQQALYIRTFTGSRESLSLTFDRPRKDKRRLHLLYDVERKLTLADIALFDKIAASLSLGNRAKSRASGVPSLQPSTTAGMSAAPVQPGASMGRPYLPSGKIPSSRIWLGPVSFVAPEQWTVSREPSDRRVAMRRPDRRAEINVILWPMKIPMPNQNIQQMDFVVIAGSPAQRLRLRQGEYTIDLIFFDEPFGDGSRLSILYRSTGEALDDGLPVFNIVLASLDRTIAPPVGTWRPLPGGESQAADPLANANLHEFIKH